MGLWGYSPTTGKIYRMCQCCFEIVPKDTLMCWTDSHLIEGLTVAWIYEICPACWDRQYEHQAIKLRSEVERKDDDE